MIDKCAFVYVLLCQRLKFHLNLECERTKSKTSYKTIPTTVTTLNAPGWRRQCTRMEETIKDYKHFLLKVELKKVEHRLETLNETPLDLREITNVTECKAIWREYNDAIEQVKRGEDMPGAMLNQYIQLQWLPCYVQELAAARSSL